MENLIDPIQIKRYDHCYNCGTNQIEMFDYNNVPMNYGKSVIEYMMTGSVKFPSFNRRATYIMKCKHCRKVYPIIWVDNFPRPLIDDGRSHKIFMGSYIDNNKSNKDKIKNNRIL